MVKCLCVACCHVAIVIINRNVFSICCESDVFWQLTNEKSAAFARPLAARPHAVRSAWGDGAADVAWCTALERLFVEWAEEVKAHLLRMFEGSDTPSAEVDRVVELVCSSRANTIGKYMT